MRKTNQYLNMDKGAFVPAESLGEIKNICGNCCNYVLRPYHENVCGVTGRCVNYFGTCDKFGTPRKTDNDMETKVCKKCGRELPLDMFGGSAMSADGHKHVCKECVSETMKESHPKGVKCVKGEKIEKPDPSEDVVKWEKAKKDNVIAVCRLSDWNDDDIINELRKRGFKGTIGREITL